MGNIFVAKVLASMSAQPAGAAPDTAPAAPDAPLEPIRPGAWAAWARSLGDEPAMARTGETVPTGGRPVNGTRTLTGDLNRA